ncbi:MAG: SPFH domain-containing protein [Phycisphaeraceae bacterium]
MAQDRQTYRRAANAAMLGLVAQIALTLAVALTGLWAQSPVLTAATWQYLGGVLIWIILWMVYHQHELERVEALELAQLQREPGSPGIPGGSALFEGQGDELATARRRLDNLYKYGLGVVGLILAAYLLVVGLVLYVVNYKAVAAGAFVRDAMGPTQNPLVLLGITCGIAFLAFIVARYHAGMTKISEWQLLRGGAGYLISNAVIALLIAVAAIFAWRGDARPLAWLRLGVPAITIAMGLEILVAFLLGAYRPRRPGEIPRPAFDSRVMGWLTRPESLAKTINQTINYQFGFEISKSWFYQLLGKALTPLFAFGLAVLILISSFIVVQPQEEAIITTFGKMTGPPVGPGLHVKWPWPIGAVDRFPVGRVQQALVGSYKEQPDATRAILWTNEHAQGKEELLITAPTADIRAQAQEQNQAGAPGMTLTAAQVNVQYRIIDSVQYANSAQDPHEMITVLADRAINRYFVTRDIDWLVGTGRLVAGQELQQQLQQDVLAAKLGVDIVFVGLAGVHPPQAGDVATAFHEQIGAIQERETTIQKAQADAVNTLAQVAGTVELADAIAQAIAQQESLRRQHDALRTGNVPAGELAAMAGRLAQQVARVEQLIAEAPGKSSQAIYEARAYRWDVSNTERGKAARFQAELAASRPAPRYFRMRYYLDVLGDNLDKPRKYIIASDQAVPGIYRIDLKDAGAGMGGIINPTP